MIFSAHSLPASAPHVDRYEQALRESAAAVAERAGVAEYQLAWQSAPPGARGWLQPELMATLQAVARGGHDAVVVCPQGFTSDHLEVLYDLDLVASAEARQLGLRFERTASLNDDPQLAVGLARLVSDIAYELAVNG